MFVVKPNGGTPQKDEFLEEMKPLLYTLRLFGRFPYCFSQNGQILHVIRKLVVYESPLVNGKAIDKVILEKDTSPY